MPQPRAPQLKALDLPAGHPDEAAASESGGVAAWYFWLFPTTMFNVYPWGISINIVEPISVNRTRVRFLPYVWDESRLDTGVSGDLDRVEREVISQVLGQCDGVQIKAAQRLGINRNTLHKKIKDYGLESTGSGSKTA